MMWLYWLSYLAVAVLAFLAGWVAGWVRGYQVRQWMERNR